METVAGANNWHLVYRREADGIVLLRAVTCDICAALPDAIDGLPVTALGNHALAPDARSVPGEELTIVCGRPGDDWNNRNLQELTLPASLRRIEQYALLNLTGLKTLNLADSVAFWGSGALLNCRSLREINLSRTGQKQGISLAALVGDIPRELLVRITEADDSPAQYYFPEYYEEYVENSPAHHFDLSITGSGYAYHAVFRGHEFDARDYDALWQRFLSAEHEDTAALQIAWNRVRYPAGLTETARAAYLAFLSAHLTDALLYTVKQQDHSGLTLLLGLPGVSAETVRPAAEYAREKQNTEASALLLEALHHLNGGTRRARREL